jgi:3-keto-5-aminohexanoate cleavage enzyme
MVHIHPRTDEGMPTPDVGRARDTYNAIRDKTPELIVNISTGWAGMETTTDQRFEAVLEIKPEMASLNTNTMNFGVADRKAGTILFEFIFENTFSMFEKFGKAIEENSIKPEIEVYDIGGLDNFLLINKQGFFTTPYNINFVWGTAGGQKFRPDAFMTLVNALPQETNFTTCGVARDQFPANMQSCICGGHMRVGLEDNVKMPNGEVAKGSYEQVEWAANVVNSLGREIATPDEARIIMGLKK